MIRKLDALDNLSGVDTPLFPLIYVNYNIITLDTNGVYAQFNSSNQPVFLISIKNGEAVLTATGDYNAEEINCFLKMMGVTSIISDALFDELDITFSECNLLKFCELSTAEYKRTQFLKQESSAEDYKGVFSLFHNDEKLFPNWYVDFVKKVILPCGIAGYVKDDGTVVSAALVTGMYENQAVISGVSTLKTYRYRGLASECVTAVTAKLLSMGVTDIYLWCEDSKLDFYKRLGYSKTSQIYIGECKL